MSGVRIDFREKLTNSVKEYLEKKEYTSYGLFGYDLVTTGKDRATEYLKKIAACQDNLVEMAMRDFFEPDTDIACLGTSKILRKRIGDVLCEEYALAEHMEKIYKKELVHPRPDTPERRITIIRRELAEHLVALRKKEVLKQLETAAMQLEEKKIDSQQDILRAIEQADKDYHAAIVKKNLTFPQLLLSVVTDLNHEKIRKPRIVLDALFADFGNRAIQKLKADGVVKTWKEIKEKKGEIPQDLKEEKARIEKKITSGFETMYFHLFARIPNHSLHVEEIAQDLYDCEFIMKEGIDFPVEKRPHTSSLQKR